MLNIFGKTVNVLCGLLVSIVLARFLGVYLRGELAFLTLTSGLAAIVLGFGVNQAFIFQFRRTRSPATFKSIAGLLSLQMGVFAVLASIATWVVRDAIFGYLAALSVSLGFYQQLESVMAAYNIRLKVKVNIVYALTRLGAYVVMWPLARAGLWWPVVISALTCVLSVVLYLWFAVDGWPARPTWQLARTTYGFGWLTMLTTLLIVLNYGVDVIVLKALGTGEDLGLYAVAAGIVTYLWVIPDAIKEVLVSRVVRTNDPRTVLRPLKAAVMAGWLSVVAVGVLGLPLIPLLFGSEYEGSYKLVLILSLGVVSMVYYKVLGIVVLAEGKRAFYFSALTVSVILNLLCNLWVIPLFGAVGVSWVSVLTYTVTGSSFVWYFSQLFGIPLGEILLFGRRDVLAMRKVLTRRA
jgi:O-antigen/teichoic acid export membrane protein